MPVAVFEEIKKGAGGALDRAKLMVTDAASSRGLIRSGSAGAGGNNNNNENGDGGTGDGADGASEQSEGSGTDRLEELAEYCPKLTFQQRLIGFAVSFSMGYMIAFFSFRFFVELVEGYPLPFAINYTVGHVLQLLASTFLCGPRRQFK